MIPHSAPRPPGPYFFLSYAHTPPNGPDRKTNRWVAKLFSDLCDHILELTNLTDASQAGFMDTGLLSGHMWQKRLSEALATCRVFVPLYSPRYFVSQNCGREWTAFIQRVNNQVGPNGRSPEVIIPALWTPMEPERLPQVARTIQFAHEQLGTRYRDEGFYGLTKLSARRHQYQLATWELARRIVEVGQSTWVKPSEPLDFASLPSAFDDFEAERPLTLTMVAPDIDHLPSGRSAYYYGRVPEEWNPFRSEDNFRSLCSYAIELAASHGFRPQPGSLSAYSPGALDAWQPTGPEVMIIDPWALTEPDRLDALAGFDRAELPWVSVIIPWNLLDDETRVHEPSLRAALEATLHKRLSDPYTESIGSFSAFGRAFPQALSRAGNQFLKKATPYPPEGQPSRKLRLMETEGPDG
ncbi:TIR-like protein FxsC [Herbidospora mongoliensis]|uniref:TIR-like protein FxsC n=1 Tax=Herbidospora mongoliensis TaxID=688067 RepID=UPI000829D810|nr:TIR-like protein FxsC [Herbidospora mongoliensis]